MTNDQDAQQLNAALKAQGVPRRTRRALMHNALHKAILRPKARPLQGAAPGMKDDAETRQDAS